MPRPNIHLFLTALDMASLGPTCPFGTVGFSSYCYLYVRTAMTQADAYKYCWELGTNLASIHSIKENGHIRQLSEGSQVGQFGGLQ